MGQKNKRASFGELDGATREEILDIINPVRYTVLTDKFWAFKNAPAGTGLNYYGGYYNFFVGNDDFALSVAFGAPTVSWGAHFFFVVGAVPGGTVTIRVSGPSISDEGAIEPADTEDVIINTGSPIDTYVETTKKWIGQINAIVVSGAPINCNYGFAKYWDNMNTDFTVTATEATWLGGANDPDINLCLRHHRLTGWTYNVGAAPDPPSPIVNLDETQAPFYDGVRNTSNGAWKRVGLDHFIEGSGSEGLILEVSNSVNRAFELGVFQVQIQVTQEATLI